MGTSSWEGIAVCVELIRRIDPQSVLDVGVGFGRWGFVCREFLEAWNGRPLIKDWKILIDGIEAFQPYLAPYHRVLYDHIFEGNALDILASMRAHYDCVILGDVLEHFTKEDAFRVMDAALSISRHILLMIPIGKDWPQDEQYGNPFEKHLSEWSCAEILGKWPVLRWRLFHDYINRERGVFLITPHEKDRLAFDLRIPLYSADLEFERAQAQAAADQESSITQIRGRLAQYMDWLQKGLIPRRYLHLRNEGKSEEARGSEIWVLNIQSSLLPFYDFRSFSGGGGLLAPHKRTTFGEALLLQEPGASVSLPVFGSETRVEFVRHPWSGIVRVSLDGGAAAQHDLFGPDSSETVVIGL